MSVPEDSSTKSTHSDQGLEPWQEFKGREDVLKALMTAWQKARQGDAQCAVLLADSGFGKTRLIHEFYRRISLESNGGKKGIGYWPDELSSDPTRIDPNPDFSNFESKAEIPWLWWGMRWGCPKDRNRSQAAGCGVVEWTNHLERHVAGLINRKAAKKVAKEALARAVEAAMDFFPIPNVVGMLSTANDCKQWVKELVEIRQNQREGFDLEKKTEEKALQAIGFLRAFLDTREKDSVSVPVILVLDDAQWADPISLKVVAQLFTRATAENWPLLVLVTHWETEWYSAGEQKAPDADAPLDQWNNFQRVQASIKKERRSGSSFQLLALGKVPDDSISQLLRSKFSGLIDEDITYVVRRCDGNPLALEEFIKVMQNESQWFEEGDTSRGIDPEYRGEFKGATLDSENRADKRFMQIAQSNPGLYEFLKLGAVQGITFYHELLTDLATELEKGDNQWVEPLIHLAENPHCIVNNLAAQISSSEFRRALYRDGLQKRMKKEWRAYRAALKTVLDRWWEEKKFPDQTAGIRLLELYAEVLEGTQTPEDQRRTVSVASRLSATMEDLGNYATALLWAELAFKALDDSSPVNAVRVRNQFANCLMYMGRFDEALETARATLSQAEVKLGPDHQATLAGVNNLANILADKGEHSAAEPLYRRAVEVQERTLGSSHPSTLKSVSNLANTLSARGAYSDAEALHRKALDARESTLGPDHYDTLQSIGNLALVLKDKGDFDAAESLIRSALEAQERTLGSEHPDTLKSIANLAIVLRDKGDYSAAEPLVRKAVDVQEKTLGRDHPSTLASLNSLAVILRAQGDDSAAEPLMRRALETQERTLGSDHPDTLRTQRDLSLVLRSKGDFAGAEVLMRRTLEAQERSLGQEHPDTLASASLLAVILRNKGDYSAAESVMRRALEAQERTLGSEHPNTLKSVSNLANILRDKGDRSAAESLYRRALDAQERIMGPEHPDTLTSINNLAVILCNKSDYGAAEPLFRKALEAQERTLGADHPETLRSIKNLALVLRDKGDYAAAEPFLRRTLEAQERNLRSDHPETLKTVNQIALCLSKRGNTKGAVSFLLSHCGVSPVADLAIAYNLACYLCLENRLDEARQWISKWLIANPQKKQIALDDPDLSTIRESIGN